MNSNLNKITEQIEQVDFKLIANQASGLSAFKKIVSSQAVFVELRRQIASDVKNAIQLVGRVHNLSSLDTDIRFEHPYDTAIATYLLALESTGSRLVSVAAGLISNTPRLWWATKIANQIITQAKRVSDSADKLIPLAVEPHFSYPVPKSVTKDSISWRVLPSNYSDNYAVILDHYFGQQSMPTGTAVPPLQEFSFRVQPELFERPCIQIFLSSNPGQAEAEDLYETMLFTVSK